MSGPYRTTDGTRLYPRAADRCETVACDVPDLTADLLRLSLQVLRGELADSTAQAVESLRRQRDEAARLERSAALRQVQHERLVEMLEDRIAALHDKMTRHEVEAAEASAERARQDQIRRTAERVLGRLSL